MQKLATFIQEKLEEFPIACGDPDSHGHDRRVTWETLTMHEVHQYFTRPLTEKLSCSFAELVAKSAECPPSWCVSHWWGERFEDVLALLNHHAKCRELTGSALYWISSLSISEREAAHAAAQLSETGDPTALPIAKALRANGCAGMVTLAGPTSAALSRSWVALEGYLAARGRGRSMDVCAMVAPQSQRHSGDGTFVDRGPVLLMDLGGGRRREVSGTAHGIFPHEVAKLGATMSLAETKTTSEEDRRTLLHILARSRDWTTKPPHACKGYTEAQSWIRAPFCGRAMFHAAHVDDGETLQRVLEAGVGGANEDVRDQGTAVHAAAAANARGCLQLLVDSRADPHRARNSDGATPAFVAASWGAQAALKVLLEAQADPCRTRASDGASPAHAAVEKAKDPLRCVNMLLEAKADPNIAKANGANLAHVAAQANAPECLQAVIHKRADVNSALTGGMPGATPTHLASHHGHFSCLQLLINHRADLERALPMDGCTAVFLAIRQDHRSCLRALLDGAADPHCTRSDGASAVCLASEKDDPPSLRLLLDAKADPDTARESDGASPSCIACMQNSVACLRLLQAARADLNQPMHNGWTAQDHAHSREVMKVLQEAGATSGKNKPVEVIPTGIRVTIVSARNLRPADMLNGKSDPYVVCEVCPKTASHWRFQTHVCKGLLDPVWNYAHVCADFKEGDSLKFDVLDKDCFPKPDDFLGFARLGSTTIYPHGYEGEVKLAKSKVLGPEPKLKIKIDVLGVEEKEVTTFVSARRSTISRKF